MGKTSDSDSEIEGSTPSLGAILAANDTIAGVIRTTYTIDGNIWRLKNRSKKTWFEFAKSKKTKDKLQYNCKQERGNEIKCFYSLTARTLDFQSGSRSSILRRSTISLHSDNG